MRVHQTHYMLIQWTDLNWNVNVKCDVSFQNDKYNQRPHFAAQTFAIRSWSITLSLSCSDPHHYCFCLQVFHCDPLRVALSVAAAAAGRLQEPAVCVCVCPSSQLWGEWEVFSTIVSSTWASSGQHRQPDQATQLILWTISPRLSIVVIRKNPPRIFLHCSSVWNVRCIPLANLRLSVIIHPVADQNVSVTLGCTF